MHELSLCRSIHGIVERASRDRAGARVSVVHLRIGQLRQVAPDTLAYCWGLLCADSPLAGSALDIDHVPVELSCRACGETTRIEHALVLVCAACGGGDIQVLRGEEMLVTSIDLETSAQGGPVPSGGI